ncbi:MAG: hypothetical protein H6705_06515 [Myxococcales bacterium]|nr:hypothetical protein [Myxococcales bacterium]
MWREPAAHRSFAAIDAHADPAAPDLAAARARLAAARAALHDDGPDLAPLAVFAAAYDPPAPAGQLAWRCSSAPRRHRRLFDDR